MSLKHLLSALTALVMAAAPAAAGAAEITHAMGVTTVPDAPQRVVVLTNEGTEALLALGVTPVGAARSWLGNPWYAHITQAMAGVEDLGTESGINLELVAALEPDLIIGNKQRHEQIYPQLSEIAPTVLSQELRGDWKINFALYAQAVGKVAEGEKVIADFDARVADLSARLGDYRKEKVSVIRFLAGQTRIYQLDSFSGVVLKQLGFDRPANQNVEEFALRVGKESIPDMDGDRIFHFTYDTGDGTANAAAQDYLNDPIWLGLEAVKAGKVHAVDDAIWNTAGGVLAANLLLDDIARIYGVQ
jgi:iron complex transport system substrate-binding protein